MTTASARRIVLNICAAGHGVTLHGHTLPLVCGRPPGHQPPHRDAAWPVEWDDTPATGSVNPVPP